MSRRIEPPSFRYPGGKVKIRSWVAGFLPPGERYVEPFAGRGGVFWLVAWQKRYPSYWLNDPATAKWWLALSQCSLAKIPFFVSKINSRQWKQRAIAGDPVARVMEAHLTYGGGTFESSTLTGCAKGGRKDLAGHDKYNWLPFRENVARAKLLLGATKPRITDFDWRDVLKECKATDCVYLDPPYLGAADRHYKALESADYLEMLAMLQSCGCSWVLSSYDTPACRRILGEPRATKKTAMRLARETGGWLPRTEAVWTGGPNLR